MKNKQPFFAKFLENQLSRREQQKTTAGCHFDLNATLKGGTDEEIEITGRVTDVIEELSQPQTDKYPSDCEDH